VATDGLALAKVANVGIKSSVQAISSLTSPWRTLPGQRTMPGTRQPPSHDSILLPRNTPALPL